MNTPLSTIPALRDFLAQHDHGTKARETLTDALKAHIAAGGGWWQAPDDATLTTRPATHLVEICAFDVVAHAPTVAEAVLHWRKLAYVAIAAAEEGDA